MGSGLVRVGVFATLVAIPLFGAVDALAKGGNERRIIVLDAGHGGRLLGTRTTGGVPESQIVLGIAKQARDVLEKDGFRVVMTREEDQDIDLDARVALANGSRAAVFVSVHSNYAPVPDRCGTETYILSPTSSDEASEALMTLENEGEAPSAREPSKAPDPPSAPAATDNAEVPEAEKPAPGGSKELDFILADLHRTAAHKDSALLARMLQDSFGKVGGLAPSRGLRQAPFKVLRGAGMPAALVEIGYLSHPAQGAFLATARGQKAAGDALARGIVRFFKDLRG